MIPVTSSKGLFYWRCGEHTAYLALATDDILLASTSPLLYEKLKATFDTYFAYNTVDGPTLLFFNYRIIQSEHGTSIDQYNHIRQSLLQIFFPDTLSVQFISSPFLLYPKIEMELFCATPLSEKENDDLAIRYHGSYNHWTDTLLHIASKTDKILLTLQCVYRDITHVQI